MTLVLQGCAVDEVFQSGGGSVGIEISVVRFADGSAADVTSVTLDVVAASGSPTYVSDKVVAKSGSSYSTTLNGLPLGVPLDFIGHAYNSSGQEIYTGTARATLTYGSISLALVLNPVGDDEPINLPIVERVLVPLSIAEGGIANISMDVWAQPGETLNYALTPAAQFRPNSGTVTTDTSGNATIATSYRASFVPGTYTITLGVSNGDGLTVEVDFQLEVGNPTSKTAVTLGLAPAISSLNAKRTGDQIIWTVAVVDDGPVSELTYTWQLDGLSFSAQNPGVLSGYDESLTGTITVEVTDNNGLGATTSASFPLVAGQFPDTIITRQ